MHECMDQGRFAAVPYFITFLVSAYFVMLQLFVAVILENFTQASKLEELKLTPSGARARLCASASDCATEHRKRE